MIKYQLPFFFFAILLTFGCSTSESSERTLDAVEYNSEWEELSRITLSETEGNVFKYIRKVSQSGEYVGIIARDVPKARDYYFRLYNTKGEQIFEITEQQITPRTYNEINSFSVVNEQVYILLGDLTIFIYDFTGKRIKSIYNDAIRDKYGIMNANLFVYSDVFQQFIIGVAPHITEVAALNKEFYQKTNQHLLFVDTLGNDLGGFGKYPKSYYDKVLLQFFPPYALTYDESNIYIVYQDSPNIKKFNLKGDLKETISGQKSKYKSYEIKSLDKEPTTVQEALSITTAQKISSFNDTYQQLELVPNEGFRYCIQNRDTTINNKIAYNYAIMEYFPKENTFTEIEFLNENKFYFLNGIGDTIRYLEVFKDGRKEIVTGKLKKVK
jgi:hypothetical protein